jgi:glutamate-5-semialdehyde dehydrogenase
MSAMLEMGAKARAAARALARAPGERKDAAIRAMAAALRASANAILAANAGDIETARASGRNEAFIDRLLLSPASIEGMAAGLEAIAAQPDPVGKIEESWTRPNGLHISRVRVPIGVIGIIYESRPGVTADAAALCVKAGNACILRCGSEALGAARAIHAALAQALAQAGLPHEAVQLVASADRDAVGEMLAGLNGAIDVIVPRGGKSLVARVQADARVPVFAHLEGICHVYVDKAADAEKARAIVLNAKMRRVSVCGAAETLLVDRSGAAQHLAPLVRALLDAGCEVRGDAVSQGVDSRVLAAGEEDWRTEYLAPIIAVRVVDGVAGAAAHIAAYGSAHTDSIVTEDKAAAEEFLAAVDSAIVLHNASTQFADGGEFGFGGEIGIATGRLHARGPVGARELTTYKYLVRGDGQVRG